MNTRVLLALLAALSVVVVVPSAWAADKGNGPATLSFFSSGGGAHAGWVHTSDQPAIDTDYSQAIRIHTTATGYAGVLVHHVYGTPTAAYPNSSFDFKAAAPGPSLGSPRLVILFSDGGRAELRPLLWTPEWQKVEDPYWDNNGGPCFFLYQTTWNTIQACHAGTFVTNVYITTDPGLPNDFLIDNLTTAGKNFSSASDNGNGSGTDDADNSTAFFTPNLLSLLSGSVL